jgi:hypothetical protein
MDRVEWDSLLQYVSDPSAIPLDKSDIECTKNQPSSPGQVQVPTPPVRHSTIYTPLPTDILHVALRKW